MIKCVLPIATLLTLLAIVVPGCTDENPLRGAFKAPKNEMPVSAQR